MRILCVIRSIWGMPEHDRVSTIEAAAMLGINRVTVARWVREGRIPAWRVGHFYKIDRAVVESLAKPTGGAR